MSRAKLSNSELRFYSDAGGTETTKLKLVPTDNSLTLQGASAGTQVKLSNLSDPTLPRTPRLKHASIRRFRRKLTAYHGRSLVSFVLLPILCLPSQGTSSP